jgi:hypothetical protein
VVAAIWYVGGPDPDDRAELRHSLRSVAANVPIIDECWVVGDVPDWFTGVKVPLEPQAEKFANARASITRFVNLPAVPSEFYLFMDDVMVTEPVTGRLPICHLGPVKNYSSYKTGNGTYARAVRQTANWLMTHGDPDPLAYLGHTPVPLDTAKVRAFLDDYPADQLLEPFLLYCVAGTDGPGTRQGNAKTSKSDTFEHKRDLPIPYISSNPDTWTGPCGDYIRAMFLDACRWER